MGENSGSILNTIKKMLGIVEDYKHFDADLIMHINSVLAVLTQVGVGPTDGFQITGETEVWEDLLLDDKNLEFVKSFVYLRVRLLFDPPMSSTVSETIKQQADELLWRVNVAAESKKEDEDG